VAAGASFLFLTAGPVNGGIISFGNFFVVPATGTYRVTFQVTVNEPGSVELDLNGVPLPYTSVGRATGTTQIVGTDLVTASAGDSLSLIASPGNVVALTVPPFSSGTNPSVTTIVIEQVP
jgi:hypothetical protein